MTSSQLTSLKAVSRKKAKWGSSLSRFGRKRQLIISVLAVYFIVGGLIGYSLWNTNGESAKASESALISGSIRLAEEKEYTVGDTISLNLTLQNTSVEESINSVALDLFSTNSAVTWTNLVGGNIRNSDVANSQKNSFKLPILSYGERVEYVATGKIEKADTEYLTVLGKVRFVNKSGLQETSTNRIFTKLKNSGAKLGRSLELTLEQEKIASNGKAVFNLKWPEQIVSPKTITGKVYLSDKNTRNVVASANCEVSATSCSGEFNNLTTGNYSILFVGKNEDVYSNISSLDVQGSTQEFTPSGLSTLEFPLGSISVNGVVPVLSKRVVSLNNEFNSKSECTFQIKSGSGSVTKFKTKVREDRSCYTEIFTSQIPSGEGIYKVNLMGTNKEQDISFLNKSATSITLENQTLVPKKGQPIQVKSVGLVDSSNQTLNNIPVSLGIYNPSSGDYKQYNSLDGNTLKVNNGIFEAKLPAEIFPRGGFYNLHIRVENGQISDFVGVNFNDTEVGVVTGGINIQNSDSLKVGQSMVFSVNNIVDRSGSVIADGECEAALYVTSLSSQAINVKGNLQQGTCKVVVQNSQVSQSGPALISFPEYGQSRQFNIFPAETSSYGTLKLEYEPAQQNFANTLIIGPVTDKFGNLSNSFGIKIELSRSSEVVQIISNVDIVDGFAKIVLPASLFSQDALQIKALASDNSLLMDQAFNIVKNDKLILPNVPKTLNGDSKLKISLGGLENDVTTCNFDWIKSESEKTSETATYNQEEKKCELDWNLSELRNTKQALVKVTAGDKTFNQVVSLTSGEAGNIFALGNSLRVESNQELDYQILSSPILDKFGLVIKQGNLRISYNGKVNNVEIIDGFARLSLAANKLDSNDIRVILGGQILELAVEAKASPISISRTNTLLSFLGKYDISNRAQDISLLEGSSVLPSGSLEIFSFKSDTCSAKQISDRQDSKTLLAHWQGGVCYVEVGGTAGSYTIQLLDGNFVLKEFKYIVTNSKDEVIWCAAPGTCVVQVMASTLGQPEATIFDGERQYKFLASANDNSIVLQEPTLNPLKKYSIQLKFTNQNNQEAIFYHQILGQKLIK